LAISGIMLIASFILMLFFSIMMTDSLGNYYGISILISSIMVLISFCALISYTKTGWRMVGSDDEWTIAGILNPMILFLRGRNDQGREKTEERADLEMDDEYYDKRKD